MKKEVAEKWVKALRSGEFKQGRKMLQSLSEDSYCCLGVLCKIAPSAEYENESHRLLGVDLGPQRRVIDWSGIKTETGVLPSTDCVRTLVGLNDSGDTFPEIADIIEKNWEEL